MLRHRRPFLISMAAAVLCVTGVPVTAVADPVIPRNCTWTVEPMTLPAGYEPEEVSVTGTDGNGNYSGHAGWGNGMIVLWTQGQPRVLDLPDMYRPVAVDENRDGTVLIRATATPGPYGDSAVFTYSGGHTGHGVRHRLPVPDGFEQPEAHAINDRGEVLGHAHRNSDGEKVTLLWRDTARLPLVIDVGLGYPRELNRDGTILFTTDNGGHLWRDGTITPIPQPPDGLTLIQDMQDAMIVGSHVTGWPDSTGLLWTGTRDPQRLEGGGTADAVNRYGLVVGSAGDLNGPPAVWLRTRRLATLPLPPGADDAEVFIIDDRAVVVGYAYGGHGPQRWRCVRPH